MVGYVMLGTLLEILASTPAYPRVPSSVESGIVQ